jgi:uncharacterized protein YndB with AHSA1/START domain
MSASTKERKASPSAKVAGRSITKAKVTMAGDRGIHVERVFNAPRSKVWRAFTEPELVAQWWGRGNKLVIERFEPERGGHWRFIEHSDQGQHGFEGRYGEVTPEERIVQTFEWDGMPAHVALETMVLEDLGDGRTKLIAESLFHTKEDRDGMVSAGMEGGMNESYAALDRLLAKLD